MNFQEREQLAAFLEQLVAVRQGGKDGEAEAMIREACSRQPDATYLLVQRAMLQEQALKAAQEEIARLRTTPAGGGFLSGNAWGNHQPSPVPQPMPAASTPAASGGSGWLGQVATTAAGVVAGGFLFQGIENLIGHHGNGNGLIANNALANLPAEMGTLRQDIATEGDNGLDSLDDGLDDGDSSWFG